MADVQASPVPERAPKKKLVWLAVVLALLLSAGGVFVWLRAHRSASAAEGPAESTLVLETFIVNLSGNLPGSGRSAYLRIGITLGLAHPSSTRSQKETVPIALVRDTVLSVLAPCRPEELLGLEGKRQLKVALLKALQERVPQMAVQNVYFTEFLVQM